jgi:hypothetical protein
MRTVKGLFSPPRQEIAAELPICRACGDLLLHGRATLDELMERYAAQRPILGTVTVGDSVPANGEPAPPPDVPLTLVVPPSRVVEW